MIIVVLLVGWLVLSVAVVVSAARVSSKSNHGGPLDG